MIIIDLIINPDSLVNMVSGSMVHNVYCTHKKSVPNIMWLLATG